MSVGKCVSCVTEYMKAIRDVEDDVDREAIWFRTVADGETLVPVWQSHTAFGQIIYACVALPTCRRHLAMKDTSSLAIPGV
jgi:hypothetical protein